MSALRFCAAGGCIIGDNTCGVLISMHEQAVRCVGKVLPAVVHGQTNRKQLQNIATVSGIRNELRYDYE